ncbi:hypothetical protein NXV53_13390 [Bacteroides faecis]|jgi:hypothetical protein|uniref:hypothetical protein n=1 Tax=Bacteroides faecis TaxID=674529 RepID=UPI0020563846|nr:hypothetical protein [Bacteroides faecis]MCS2576370.1 hypothetical protein [Bacteroides faecis]MCS3325564.1 hypothetical protein [Bacteroides faecis]DAR72694.1 MAG TPA: hypothetical protein [Caudoviricetes sp.]
MGCISVHIEAIKGIGNVSAKADEMKVSASATGMKVSIGVVCDVGQKKYVKVTPKHIWLTPDNDYMADVDIMSNTVWTIVQTE